MAAVRRVVGVFALAARAPVRSMSSKVPLSQGEWQALTKRVTNMSVEDASQEIARGCGFVLFDNIFSAQEIDEANAILQTYVDKELNKELTKEEYTFGKDTGHDNIYNKQAAQGVRVWNLLEKGAIFEKMVQPEVCMRIIDRVIGDDFCLGSIAANYLQPGAGAQKPHLDYPYWDYVNGHGKGTGAWPSVPKAGPEHTFIMNMQLLIMMDDFTVENGGTAVVPYSQRTLNWPSDEDKFYKECSYVTGRKGTVLLFTGLMQHCSTANKSNAKRTSILSQYLPKYVRPMEDMDQIGEAVRRRATPRMRQLLGEHTPYPKVFE